ncbi:hypothetical protein [Saccharothrix obliqua]|uniref:hypothetical protein n=1 Tax=Saccharothrix obliqua TaxID=2861747 RepID=UPI001C5E5787|nr:hypothetical protein [Saccharothrix obliqua]MBW4721363.1 hypothetical protein [Saccharothrix obliqua]
MRAGIGRVSRWRSWLPGTVIAAVIALPVVFTIAWTGLNHDVRYVLGCLRVGRAAGLAASEVFVHRPLAYRWVMAGLDSVSAGPLAVREALVRAAAVVVVGLCAWWLRAGLARFVASREATAVAVAVGAALALAPNWGFLQPEWVAAVFAVAAVAAALWFDRVALAGVVGGVLLALVVLVKYTTAPVALLAVGVVAALDRRRAVALAGASVPAGGVLFGLAVLVEPREWRWLWELPSLNPPNPVTRGLVWADGQALAVTVANEALLAPVLAALPVAVALLVRLAGGRRERTAWLVAPALGVLVVLAGVVVQGQWFQYHLVVLAVFAAGLWALAVTRWWVARGGLPWPLVGLTAVAAVGAPVVSAAPVSWRLGHGAVVYGVLVVLVLLALVASVGGRFVTASRPGLAVAAVVGVSALVVPVWPTSPYSFDNIHTAYTNAERVQAVRETGDAFAPLRERIGAETPVTYLAFGDMGYLLGNPTTCRYPSPVFLQRTTYLPGVDGLESYRENLNCLSDNASRYLVVQPSWFRVPALPEEARSLIEARYDCDRAIPAGPVLACPRR